MLTNSRTHLKSYARNKLTLGVNAYHITNVNNYMYVLIVLLAGNNSLFTYLTCICYEYIQMVHNM